MKCFRTQLQNLCHLFESEKKIRILFQNYLKLGSEIWGINLQLDSQFIQWFPLLVKKNNLHFISRQETQARHSSRSVITDINKECIYFLNITLTRSTNLYKLIGFITLKDHTTKRMIKWHKYCLTGIKLHSSIECSYRDIGGK